MPRHGALDPSLLPWLDVSPVASTDVRRGRAAGSAGPTGRLPLAVRAYEGAAVAAGATLLWLLAELPQASKRWEFVGLLVAAVAVSTLQARTPPARGRSTMSMSLVIDFAALLLLGPHTAILIPVAAGLFPPVLRANNPRRLYQTLFTGACTVVAMEASGFCYQVLGGTQGGFVWPWQATPAMTALIVYFLVNSGSMALAASLSTGQSITRLWQEDVLWSGPQHFVGASIATVLSEVIDHRVFSFLPLVAVAGYLWHRAYAVYAGRLDDEHRHREVIESLNEGMAVIDDAGRVTLWNDALERMTGCPRDRAAGRSLVEAVPKLAWTKIPAAVREAGTNAEPRVLEQVMLPGGPGGRILRVRVIPYAGGVSLFWNDITDRAQAEEALKRSEERYALAASGANDGLWDWDLLSGAIYLSGRWLDMLGLPKTAVTGAPQDWLDRVHPDDLTGLRAALEAHLKGATTHFEHEHRVRHEDGHYRWFLCRGVAVWGTRKRAERIAGSFTDITNRMQAEEQLRQAANHDALTGFPNRARFMELLSEELDQFKHHDRASFAVLFLDVDRFKVVNDSLGHLIGDELLVAVSRRLHACLRNGDVLARLGGDEFTLLLKNLPDHSQAREIADRIQFSMKQPWSLHGREVFCSVSIGIAFGRDDYSTPEEIMRDADAAMYRAKARGRARHEVFDGEMLAETADRLGFESDLRRAIASSALTLQYQPIVSLARERLTGFEALVRWDRAGETVPPSRFIPVAEELGFIEPLGTWVMQEACRAFAGWRTQFSRGAVDYVSVNVSPRQLGQPNFVGIVLDVMKDSKLREGELRLEITETALVDNPERARDVLHALREFGVKVYLDDFGTGFSSLSHLHRLPVDTLKIDRSFVSSLTSSDRPPIVESILALAKTLGTRVVAEGVETEHQARELMRLGCAQAQGYFFSRPLPEASATRLLAGLQPSTTRPATFGACPSPPSGRGRALDPIPSQSPQLPALPSAAASPPPAAISA